MGDGHPGSTGDGRTSWSVGGGQAGDDDEEDGLAVTRTEFRGVWGPGQPGELAGWLGGLGGVAPTVPAPTAAQKDGRSHRKEQPASQQLTLLHTNASPSKLAWRGVPSLPIPS
ncbi:hypothetical protein CIHG_04440 [Coccidioides immitis H538.4]|uniref:Uncharacterized protein n=1 Tax=Coccidioides immitis H538.4 TaxID=396776 RepID=A0A0J8RPX1_COCIT|nr:hypothetical protein CIHG_04440 [Coccidioides immitis H538.4]